MEIGLKEWFNDSKGYGVLKTPNNSEIFLHLSNWVDSTEFSSSNNTPVLFIVGVQRNKRTALSCKYFNPEDESHWEKVFSLKEYNYCIVVNSSPKNLIEIVISKLDSTYDFKRIGKYITLMIDNISGQEFLNRNELIYKIYNNAFNIDFKRNLEKLIISRIKMLSDHDILLFWKDGVLPNFLPNLSILTKYHKEIGISELNRIDNNETRHLIILNKLKTLIAEFDLNSFLNFQVFYNLVDSENLKNKLRNDLTKMARSSYMTYMSEEIIELTRKPFVTVSELKQFIERQPVFLDEKFIEELTELLIAGITENSSFRIIIECWKENLIKNLDNSIINSLKNQSKEDLVNFLNSKKTDRSLATQVFDIFLENQDFETLLVETHKFNTEVFNRYDNIVFNTVPSEVYFELWKGKKGKILPKDFLSIYLNNQEERYFEFEKLVGSKVISLEDYKNILISNVRSLKVIDDRIQFYTILYSVKYLLKNDPSTLVLLESLKSDFVGLILWHFKKRENFDFDILTGKFIYFQPKDQVFIFKRLFYLKNEGRIEFDLEKLDKIIRADLDLYLENRKINDDFVLDISTHVLIECLKSFNKSGNFIFESDLILKDLKQTPNKRFKIGNYFDHCEGRETADWNWETSGKISRVKIESEGRVFDFYKVHFPYDEDIVADIKTLPKRKFYDNGKYWGVSLSSEKELFKLAKKHRLFIDLPDKKHYENNIHLVEYSRMVNVKNGRWEKNIPTGITFCEGRKAKKEHGKLRKEFWWCSNQECFQNCVNEHISNEYKDKFFDQKASNHLYTHSSDSLNKTIKKNKNIWEEYTLFDFLKILDIDVDEHNGLDVIKNGHYYKFLGHINAFNRLLERLYCEECNNLLYPRNTSHFALYRDVRFNCIEETCSKKHTEIYLNHCLYGECKTIIDSRTSKQCKHGLYICHNCGTCCSEESFKRRLENLEKTGGFIHPNLIKNVNERQGHLEKKEYYCFKCAGMMTEVNDNNYICNICNTKYRLDKFKWLDKKWTQVSRRRADYPTSWGEDNTTNDILPF